MRPRRYSAPGNQGCAGWSATQHQRHKRVMVTAHLAAACGCRVLTPAGSHWGVQSHLYQAWRQAACLRQWLYSPSTPLGAASIYGNICRYRLGQWRRNAYADIAARLGACRAWGVESENRRFHQKRPQRGQFLPDLQPHSSAMGQKDGEKWTAAVDSQPTLPKSDRLLGIRLRCRCPGACKFPEWQRSGSWCRNAGWARRRLSGARTGRSPHPGQRP